MDQSKGLKRNTIDKYYTRKKIVKKCLHYVKKIIDIHFEDDMIIEPSAGNGKFINGLNKLCKNCNFYDIEPENDLIKKQDYLQLNIINKYNNIHVIGNPPFGRQSSLVIKFIKKSILFASSISFILPKSFKKDSLKKHFPLSFHLEKEIDLPDNSFTVNNEKYDVPCIFQIWIKKDFDRKEIKKLAPINFTFVKKDNKPDISFRRVGVYAGFIDKNKNKSIQSHYFIKFDKFNDKLFDKLKIIDFDCKNYTVGPKSISKQELIKEYNKLTIL